MEELIIDTDAGIDDAVAIMLALLSKTCKVAALTVVTGNSHVDRGVKNMGIICDVVGVKVPFYRGADRPIISRDPLPPWEGHGLDGLGNANWDESPHVPEKEHAVLGLINMVNARPNTYTIIALGPLTNLALATRLDPTFPSKVKRLVFMGGTESAKGNSSMVAEFNVHFDPEAASIVLSSFKTTEMISWELTETNACSWVWFHQWVDHTIPNKHPLLCKFLKAMFNKYSTMSDQLCLCDVVAVAVAMNANLVERKSSFYIEVELAGNLTRGQTVIDHYSISKKPVNVEVIQSVNQSLFLDMLHDLVLHVE